jgi:hypothetical protein
MTKPQPPEPQSPQRSHQASNYEQQSDATPSHDDRDDCTDRVWYKHFESSERVSLKGAANLYAPNAEIKPMMTDLCGVGQGRFHPLLYCRVYHSDFGSIIWPATANDLPVNRIYPFWEDRNNPWYLSIYCPASQPDNGLHTPPKAMLVRSQGKNGDPDIPRLSRAQTHVLREYLNTVASLPQFQVVPEIHIVTLPHPFRYREWSDSLYAGLCRYYDMDSATTYNRPRFDTSTSTLLSWRRIDPDWAYTSGLYDMDIGEWSDQVDIIPEEDGAGEVGAFLHRRGPILEEHLGGTSDERLGDEEEDDVDNEEAQEGEATVGTRRSGIYQADTGRRSSRVDTTSDEDAARGGELSSCYRRVIVR